MIESSSGQSLKKVFPILAISVFSSLLGIGIISPLLPHYAESLGATGIWIGVIFAAMSISRLIVLPVMGSLSDRKGRKLFICIGLFAYAVISLGYIHANSISELILVRLIQGIAGAMIVPIAQAYVGDISPKGKEGVWMGYFNASFIAGLASGPILGGLLTDYFSIEVAFYTMGSFNLLAFFLALFLLPEIRSVREKGDSLRHFIARIMENGVLKGVYTLRIVQSAGRGGFMAFFPILVAVSPPGLSLGKIGVLMAVRLLLVSVFSPFLGKVSDVFNRKSLIIAGGVINLAFFALVPQMQNFWQLLVLCISSAFGVALTMTSLSALAVEEGRKYGMGSAMGVNAMAIAVGTIIGPIIGGVIADSINVDAVFYFGSCIWVLGLCLFLWFTRARPAPNFLPLEKGD